MSMNMAQIVDEILAAVSRGDMTTAAIRLVRKCVSKQIADCDRAVVLQAAHELIRRAPYGRFVAYELVQHHAATLQCIDAVEVEALGAGMSTWAEVDTFSLYVAGPAWRLGRISDSAVRRWARSDDRWWRRAALVSTVPGTSSARTLAVCRLLLSDRDDMVVKAMSWALRALTKQQPEVAEKFIGQHRTELAPRVIREVTNKLKTGLKNPRKRVSTQGSNVTHRMV